MESAGADLDLAADEPPPGWLDRARNRLREVLPVVEYGTCAGVQVPAPATARRLFDTLRPGVETPEHLPFEGALANVQRIETNPDDHVVIAGGGYGITTTLAAAAGADVTVFEPALDRRAAIRQTLRLNDVSAERVTLHDAVVGELNSLEAAQKDLDSDGVTVHEPVDLPPCDVLELDCEGAELAILEGLDTANLPRVLAVEVHPIKLDGGASEIVPTLEGLGYEIWGRYTHDGIEIDAGAYRGLLRGDVPEVGGEAHQAFPPVVVAGRSTGAETA